MVELSLVYRVLIALGHKCMSSVLCILLSCVGRDGVITSRRPIKISKYS
jgi:hypothetical protein